jgi:phosphoribosylformylglycinamidine synthase subunit PurQ / glutaminase
VERIVEPLTGRCAVGQELVIPVKNGEGCWYAPPELLAELEANGQVVLRYAEDYNGSVADVAGVTNEAGTVMGLMPHPEHAVDALLGSTDGALILGSLADAVRDRMSVAA